MSRISAQNLIVLNINREIDAQNKLHSSVSSGKKQVHGKDSSQVSLVAKNNQVLKNLRAAKGNIQNSLSFLQTQDAALITIGNIIDRCAELKASHLSSFLNNNQKENYDKEFKELQLELRDIREYKFNGVSLFALEEDPTLVSDAVDPNDLESSPNQLSEKVLIKRTGIFDEFGATTSIPVEAGQSGGTGGPNEFVENISLKNFSGRLKLIQWPMTAPDLYTVYHGGVKIYEQAYGFPPLFGGQNTLTMQNGSTHTVTANQNGGDMSKHSSDGNIDYIEFGKGADSGNQSSSMQIIINESGQLGLSTRWDMGYEIEYDPIEIELGDPQNIWSLGDFKLEDLEGFIEVVSTARAENGASAKALEVLNERFEESIIELEKHGSNVEDLNIAQAMADLRKSEALLSLNMKFIHNAAAMDHLLIDDFLLPE